MAPKKRPLEEVDPAEPSETKGQGKKSQDEQKSKKEKKPTFGQQVIEECFGKAKERDSSLTEGNDAEWIEKLALHLAHAPQFIEWCKSGTDFSELMIWGWWVAAIYLPGKYNTTYKTNQEFLDKWWDNRGPSARRPKVVRRAYDIVMNVHDISNTDVQSVTLPPPTSTKEAQDKRQQLFKLQTTCLRLIVAVDDLAKTQNAVSRLLQDCLVEEVKDNQKTAQSERREAIVEELGLLETVRQDFKDSLQESQLNDVGLLALDQLLKLVPEKDDNSKLFEIHQSGQDNMDPDVEVAEAAADDDYVPTVEEIRQAIATQHSFTPDYLSALVTEDKLASGVFKTKRKSVKGEAGEALQQTEAPKGPVFLDPKGMKAADNLCAIWLKDAANNFDKARFKVAFTELEQIVERPEECIKASRKDHLWIWKKGRHWWVAKDNMWHVRSLIRDLCNEGLLLDNSQYGYTALQHTLRRMWALVSLMSGCFGDVDLLLTVMDRLMEDLAEMFEGAVDVRMETVTMQKVAAILAARDQDKDQDSSSRPPQAFIESPEVLERHHRVRLALSETMVFYRGAVVLAVSHFSPGSGTKEQKKIWYEKLLTLLNQCGHPSCKAQIQVKLMNFGGTRKGFGKRDADKGKEKYSISIAVKDARVGFPDQRAHLSENRPFVYPCLSNMVGSMFYSFALGVFLHYFSHIYHPVCRPFRGKYGLRDVIIEEEKMEEEDEEAGSEDHEDGSEEGGSEESA